MRKLRRQSRVDLVEISDEIISEKSGVIKESSKVIVEKGNDSVIALSKGYKYKKEVKKTQPSLDKIERMRLRSVGSLNSLTATEQRILEAIKKESNDQGTDSPILSNRKLLTLYGVNKKYLYGVHSAGIKLIKKNIVERSIVEYGKNRETYSWKIIKDNLYFLSDYSEV